MRTRHFILLLILVVCNTVFARKTDVDADSVVRHVLDSLRIYGNNSQQLKQRLDYLSNYEQQLSDPMLIGELYRQRGHYEQDYGSTVRAHNYFKLALQNYEKVNNELSAYWKAECLVAMASEFYSLKDTIGLNSVAANLDTIISRYNTYPISYQYHHAWYHIMDCKYRYTKSREQRNGFFNHLYSTIAAANNMTKQQLIEYQICPAWDYYNLASGYDVFTDPKQIDSINKYLDLCEQAIPLSKFQSDISNLNYRVANERVWVQYYQHKYDSVEYGFNRMLDMLANDRHMLYRDLISNQQQLYLFIKEFNCATGNYRAAYKYQQMQYDEERKIFDLEKMKAISNIEIAFDAERKEQEILRLKQQNEVNKRNYIITIIAVLSILIILVLVLIIRWAIRKNRDQQLYEAALEAELQKENRNTSIKQIIKRMSVDFPKYESMFNEIDLDAFQELLNKANSPLTSMDLQYLIVFQGMNLKPVQVAEMFNVEAASVYTVRYRIRKKFPQGVFS